MESTTGENTRSNESNWMAIVFAALADTAAAAILLAVVSLPPYLAGFAAVALHAAAIALVGAMRGVRTSRRWLCIAAVAALPVAGVAVAAATMAGRGRGSGFQRRKRTRRRREPAVATVERLGDALSPCDALSPGDGEPRRAALLDLSRRSDPEAIALLRWAAGGRDPDLALSAALVLDEIRERAERRALWPNRVGEQRAAR